MPLRHDLRNRNDSGVNRRVALRTLTAAGAAAAFWRPVEAFARAGYTIAPDIVVAADGTGDFTSVQAAVQSIPQTNRERVVVLIKDGVYREAVRVDAAYVTLRGESRQGARLELTRPSGSTRGDSLGAGILNSSSTAHDLVIENLTVHNTVQETGPHAFAIVGRSDRIVVQNADVLSRGADTLSLWRQLKTAEEAGLSEGPGATPLTADGGRYYKRNLRITGSVDFVCPRGWCYMTDSQIEQVHPQAEAAFWHDGGNIADKKFVIRNTRADGPPDFFLARAHRDAQFYFLDCQFTDRMRDKPPHLVNYPLDGGPPTAEDDARNAKIASETRVGVRSYYSNTRRPAGDYSWMADNLGEAVGSPRAEDITAKWTFGGTWDPENPVGPRAGEVRDEGGRIHVVFDRLVTVKGQPELLLEGGQGAEYVSGSGTNALVFARPPGARGRPTRLTYERGAVIGSEAAALIMLAEPDLPA